MKRERKLAYERTFYGGIGRRTADIEVFAENRDKDIFRKEMY